MLFVRMCLRLVTPVYVQSNYKKKTKTKTKTKHTASVLNSYNFTILWCIPFEKDLCFKPK